MATENTPLIPDILKELPSRFRGPGGAVAVVKDGELVGEQVWGFADMHRHIPMAADTVIPICSISKQMLCGLLMDLRRRPTPAMVSDAGGRDPSQLLQDELEKYLPRTLLDNTGLSFELLCNNQSGIRDYWALTVLWGAMPDGPFSIAKHGPLMLERVSKSFHFEPGTEYSYANTNFFIVARILEQATGQPLAELLMERIFAPAGMKTARLCADTATHPPPCVGYEGDENFGFYPAVNRIEWAGDAGIVASLADMVAYERFVDANSANTDGCWYGANSAAQTFKGGAPADYGFGLARAKVGGVLTVRHGGALRGYRLDRLYAPDHRVSVVALLNQEHGKAGEVSDYVLKRVLSIPTETKHEEVEAGPGWTGTYLDAESQLAITVSLGVAGQLLIKYHRKPEKFRVIKPLVATADDSAARLEGDTLHLDIPTDNRKITATRVAAADEHPPNDIVGEYRCEEMDSVFHCSGTGSMLYGSFNGFLGKGPVHMMRPLAKDIWALACPRAMDSTPPGDWTIIVKRDGNGKVVSVTIGCWLARKLQFDRA